MDKVKITYVGHATTLVEAGETRILTDPIFSDNIYFVHRAQKPGLDPANLPPLSAVLISHTHLDHLDFPSFKYIKTTTPIVVPEGSGSIIVKYLPNPVIELGSWATHEFDGFKIHAVPMNHASRLLCPYRFKKASGYVIEIAKKSIFFAGDSSYTPAFRDIGDTYSIDAALLPIGAYKPSFYMKRYHMNPAEAVQAFLDLKAKVMIPIHWGTFRLSLEKLEEPVEYLKKAADEQEVRNRVKILEPGGSLDI